MPGFLLCLVEETLKMYRGEGASAQLLIASKNKTLWGDLIADARKMSIRTFFLSKIKFQMEIRLLKYLSLIRKIVYYNGKLGLWYFIQSPISFTAMCMGLAPYYFHLQVS